MRSRWPRQKNSARLSNTLTFASVRRNVLDCTGCRLDFVIGTPRGMPVLLLTTPCINAVIQIQLRGVRTVLGDRFLFDFGGVAYLSNLRRMRRRMWCAFDSRILFIDNAERFVGWESDKVLG